jgi:O-antigen/teichoic acid export membrane protein
MRYDDKRLHEPVSFAYQVAEPAKRFYELVCGSRFRVIPWPQFVDFVTLPGNASVMPDGPNATHAAQLIASSPQKGAWTIYMAGMWKKIIHNPSAMIIGNTATQSVLRLLSNIALARLLDPSAFALTAITSLILTGIQMVSDVGIAITALREGEISREDEDRLWSMQVLRGIGVGLLTAAAAIPVGLIYGDSRLRDVLFALALMPILESAQSLYPVLALRHRRLLPTTLTELVGRIVAMTISILVALVSPTVWALLIGTLAATIMSVFTGHFMAGRLPRFVFDRAYIARQWRFARWIQTSSTLTFVGGQIDKAAFPFLFGMSALGVYGIGATLAGMPSQITQRWSASVFYPLAVQLLRGEAAARARLMAVRTTMLLYTAIATLAVMAGSPSFFLLLYQPRYHAAAAIAEILAAGTFFDVAESSLRHFPLVEGTPHFEVWTVLVRLAAFAVAVGIVYLTGAGIAGYALSYVAGLAASHLFMLGTCVRRGYLRPGVDLLLVAALVGTATLVHLLPLERTGAVALVAQGAVVAVVAGAAMMLVYWRRGFPSLPAEPAPEVLREVAEDDLGLRVERP